MASRQNLVCSENNADLTKNSSKQGFNFPKVIGQWNNKPSTPQTS